MLKKADAFQGKRKVKDWWSKVEYEVICQIANGVPSYEIKDSSSNVKVAHRNQLFLLATSQGEVTPLWESEDADTSVSCQSALAELTPLECKNDLLKDNMEGCLTQHLASCIPLGWVDGILHHFSWWSTDQHTMTTGQEQKICTIAMMKFTGYC